MGLSSIRQNDITGAPIRSEPKLGNACACRPSLNAAEASSFPESPRARRRAQLPYGPKRRDITPRR